MSELIELAERVEAASGPDRNIDYRLACWFNPDADVPRYTASLDAALSLVPEGWGWGVDSIGIARISNDRDGSGPVLDGDAATPALALTAACLRAISARTSTPEGRGS